MNVDFLIGSRCLELAGDDKATFAKRFSDKFCLRIVEADCGQWNVMMNNTVAPVLGSRTWLTEGKDRRRVGGRTSHSTGSLSFSEKRNE